MDRTFTSGMIVQHFKRQFNSEGNTYLYRIVGIAQHTETGEQLMVYQALYGDRKPYARPLAMFMSEVDHDKYPLAQQNWRFEPYEGELVDEKNK